MAHASMHACPHLCWRQAGRLLQHTCTCMGTCVATRACAADAHVDANVHGGNLMCCSFRHTRRRPACMHAHDAPRAVPAGIVLLMAMCQCAWHVAHAGHMRGTCAWWLAAAGQRAAAPQAVIPLGRRRAAVRARGDGAPARTHPAAGPARQGEARVGAHTHTRLLPPSGTPAPSRLCGHAAHPQRRVLHDSLFWSFVHQLFSDPGFLQTGALRA